MPSWLRKIAIVPPAISLSHAAPNRRVASGAGNRHRAAMDKVAAYSARSVTGRLATAIASNGCARATSHATRPATTIVSTAMATAW